MQVRRRLLLAGSGRSLTVKGYDLHLLAVEYWVS
jgi:hypothetical protein